MANLDLAEPDVFQGQFGTFTLTQADRLGVKVYRGALAVAAASFALGTVAVLTQGPTPDVLTLLTGLFALFSIALGVSLWTIHIYLAPLHRLLQVCWGIGCTAALGVALAWPEPLLLTIYNRPLTLLGVGFLFVALTGIYFKEAFCFARLETKVLTPLVPVLLLGHLVGILPLAWEQALLGIWAVLFGVFALRKVFQEIPPDVGDKTVYEYLRQRQQQQHQEQSEHVTPEQTSEQSV
ncbi:DUF2301 domain-containing membrane protein [Leptolyngbya sp. FACHB-261]|uniref:DUF2301 domain-containing membrane protein n=1 Tax=Leptolyngbya sp. FACHB-261 TaxID=2692806 RepID=UPI0016889EFF|nr:DUF2301 domain-containing membrane protein [Leptolyngbya sp. FACHB-261]MBD2099639.1 DUF2301 domain-containing membrane protein [Leptolyngbya sp. FACHB-261]